MSRRLFLRLAYNRTACCSLLVLPGGLRWFSCSVFVLFSCSLIFVFWRCLSRRDSNPQPSDRQSVYQKLQLIVNKIVRRNAKEGLPPDLPQTLNKWPELATIIKKWPDLPQYIRQAILALIKVPE